MIIHTNNSIVCDNNINDVSELKNNEEYIIKKLATKINSDTNTKVVFFDYMSIKPSISTFKTKDYYILEIMNRNFIIHKNSKLLYINGDDVEWGDVNACTNNKFYIIVNNNIITTSNASKLTIGKSEKEFVKLSDKEYEYIITQNDDDLIQIVIQN